MAWSGFSEEMIRQMKEEGVKDGMANSKPRSDMKSVGRRGRSSARRGRMPASTRKSSDNGHESSLKPEQKLTPSPSSHPENQAWKDLQMTQKKKDSNHIKQKGFSPSPVEEKEKTHLEDKFPEPEKEMKLKILDEEEGKQRELSKLQKLQEQQKQIEEDNKKKKALLFQALENRKKKTQEEAKRLAFVQKELSKIENLLTNDVKILRDKIEDASRQYTEAERRYQNAEKEFVAAKMYLHKMEEKKEALTEHLFAIIHQNELRKAKKLEELVTSLDSDELHLMPDESQVTSSPVNHSPQSETSTDVSSQKTEEKVTDGTSEPKENDINSNKNEVKSQEKVDVKSTKLSEKSEGESEVSTEKHKLLATKESVAPDENSSKEIASPAEDITKS